MAQVLWRDAQGREGSLELSGGEIHIGRAMDCAIRTDDGMVSRHHARLFWDGSQYFLEDLGSANGVFFQEQRVTRHALKHGDAVRCGSLWLRFVDPTALRYADPHAAGQPVQQPVGQMPPQPPVRPETHQGVTPPSHGTPQHLGQPGSQPVPLQPRAETHAQQPGYGQPQTGAQSAVPAEPKAWAQQAGDISGPAPAAADDEEARRLKRRIEQLETELRLYRKGRGEEIAQNIDRLQEKNAALEKERDELRTRVRDLELTIEQEGSDAKSQRANRVFTKTAEAVQQLNDILSNLRINVMAAEGEFEQFAQALPRASFELIREALRSSSKDVDTARELLRELRDMAGS